jgi:hypothetical protein
MLSCFVYGQQNFTPEWIIEDFRNAAYPSDVWYVGFSQNTLTDRTNVSGFLRTLERDAQNKLIESIIVRISGDTRMQSRSMRTTQGNSVQTESSRDYEQNIRAVASAELANAETRSYHDLKTNKIYALATVRRSDLISYYANRIESALNETQRNLNLSKQLLERDRRREALEKLKECRKILESIVYYRDLLIAVDIENGLKRSQNDRINTVFKEIADLQAKGEVVRFVFVKGTESIAGQPTDIVMSGLQTLLSDNNVATTLEQKEADYILGIDAKICNQRSDRNFHYVDACVKVTLTNVKTGVNEITATVIAN